MYFPHFFEIGRHLVLRSDFNSIQCPISNRTSHWEDFQFQMVRLNKTLEADVPCAIGRLVAMSHLISDVSDIRFRGGK